MAEAQRQVERRVVEDVTIVLKLSEDEARTLAAVLSSVEGNRSNSPREHAVAVLNALREAQVLRRLGSPFEVATVSLPPDHPAMLISGMVSFAAYPA
jgi:hypothetical protein